MERPKTKLKKTQKIKLRLINRAHSYGLTGCAVGMMAYKLFPRFYDDIFWLLIFVLFMVSLIIFVKTEEGKSE